MPSASSTNSRSNRGNEVLIKGKITNDECRSTNGDADEKQNASRNCFENSTFDTRNSTLNRNFYVGVDVGRSQDLTAWVDFSALADAARVNGLEPAGYATQAHFLLESGVEAELARLVAGAAERDRPAHRQAAATLLLPGEMGERFKVMALARAIRGPLHGFGFRDFGASL